MPRKKIRNKIRIEPAPEWLFKFLATGECPSDSEDGALACWQLQGKLLDRRGSGEFEKIWKSHRDKVLADFIRKYPGHRPWVWWEFNALESRKQISGKGVVSWERYPAIKPLYSYGAPGSWYEIDESDPPFYESEATFLKRHDILTLSEKKKLKSHDFEPVNILEIIGKNVDK